MQQCRLSVQCAVRPQWSVSIVLAGGRRQLPGRGQTAAGAVRSWHGRRENIACRLSQLSQLSQLSLRWGLSLCHSSLDIEHWASSLATFTAARQHC